MESIFGRLEEEEKKVEHDISILKKKPSTRTRWDDYRLGGVAKVKEAWRQYKLHIYQ